MSDLAKNLLTQYYGLGTETSNKRFLSIHQSVEDAKHEEKKQITEETSSTTIEDNVSDEGSSKDNDESCKLSVAEDSYLCSSEVFDNPEDIYDLDENLDDFGPNIMHDLGENTQSSANDQSSNAIKETVEDSEVNDSKDTNENDMSLTFIEDAFLDSGSDISQKSAKTTTNSIVELKKNPICNQTFADFSGTELKQFPIEIFNEFPRLRMLYLADNNLTELPADIFASLRHLEWLDLRNNQLSSLPITVKFHACLETLLLQGNKIENLPYELCTLPKLKTLQVAENPLNTPPRDIVASGCSAILEFLRVEWNNAHPEERVEFKENQIKPKLSTILCYQSPRRNKKKTVPLKSAVRDRNLSTTEKRKSYKPSNRYNDEEVSLIDNNYCLAKLTGSMINKKIRGTFFNNSENCKNEIDVPFSEEIDEINDKVLHLMGPSPRSLYVRKNIKILRTYERSARRECRDNDKFHSAHPMKVENKIFCRDNGKYKKYRDNVEKVERVFDIITKDGKRFTLNPMRLNDPDWMLSCLENYTGINKCENKGRNITMEYRSLWFSKLKDLFAKQASMLQKVKDENVLKQWRRDRRSFNRSMEKAMKRNEDDIPFGFDLEDYATIFKHHFKLDNQRSKIKRKQKFIPPTDVNKKINELLQSLNELEVRDTDAFTPRTKQNLFKNEIEKILQFQSEIENLRRYTDVASVSLKN